MSRGLLLQIGGDVFLTAPEPSQLQPDFFSSHTWLSLIEVASYLSG